MLRRQQSPGPWGALRCPGGSGAIDVSTSNGVFTVEYSVDPVTAELSLSSRGGEKYSAPVVATATEAGGGNATTGSATFDPLGYYTGFRPGDLARLDSCMGKYLRSVRLRPRDLLIPSGPDPYRARWRDRINQSRVQEVVRRIIESHPGQAVGLSAVVALRYGGMR